MNSYVSNLSNIGLFILCLFLVIFFSLLYMLSDWPAEQERRQEDPDRKKQDLSYIDYFIFSISVWTTVGGGASRFATADWEMNTRYIYMCQLISLLYVILVGASSPAKYLF